MEVAAHHAPRRKADTMAKKLDAEAISTAVYEIEENARMAAFAEIRDEIADWLAGKNLSPEAKADLPEMRAGYQDVVAFIEDNYGIAPRA